MSSYLCGSTNILLLLRCIRFGVVVSESFQVAKCLMSVLMMLPENIPAEVAVEVAPDCMDVIGVVLDVVVLD